MKVLNVGGNSKDIALPSLYEGWEHILLDIDPLNKPDIVCDAREMMGIEKKFDSVYCSHTLEHFYPHDVSKVLKGFNHVLDKNGFVFIAVPDLTEVIKLVYEQKLDLDATLYHSIVGPIQPLDVIYGFHKEIERSGQDWFAHKIGYSPKLIRKYLEPYFKYIHIKQENLEIVVIASNVLKENPFV